jgi:hypothetical protein
MGCRSSRTLRPRLRPRGTSLDSRRLRGHAYGGRSKQYRSTLRILACIWVPATGRLELVSNSSSVPSGQATNFRTIAAGRIRSPPPRRPWRGCRGRPRRRSRRSRSWSIRMEIRLPRTAVARRLGNVSTAVTTGLRHSAIGYRTRISLNAARRPCDGLLVERYNWHYLSVSPTRRTCGPLADVDTRYSHAIMNALLIEGRMYPFDPVGPRSNPGP